MAVEEYSIVRFETLQRERRLPLPGQVLVEKGDSVDPDTVVAETEFIPGDPYVVDLKSEMGLKKYTVEQLQNAIEVSVGDRVSTGDLLARVRRGLFAAERTAESPVDGVVEYVSAVHARILVREEPQSAEPVVVVNVARKLDVWPAMVRMYLRFREGQEVKQGEILAASPGTGGMDYAYAPASGTIQRIDVHNGLVYIVRPQQTTRATAYISGEVDEIIDNEGVVIEGTAVVVNGVFGLGGENFGELMVMGETGQEITPEDLGADVAGKVVVIPGTVNGQVLTKAEELGARGVIVGGANEGDLVEFLEDELGAGITGEEPIDLTVILTEGFGRIFMAPEVFNILRQHQGKVVSLNGRTQVRAGAQRPEVIIPASSSEKDRDLRAGMNIAEGDPEPGQLVRIVADPYFGAFGEVTEVLPVSEEYETEASLPSVRVKLRDGNSVVVPIANIEFFADSS